MNLWRTKTIEQSIRDTEEPTHKLRKQLGAMDLTVFGVGVVIGTGIFVLTGKAAGVQAGPAVALSFVFAAIAQLCEHLTATKTRYPGTDLILRYEVKTHP